MGEEHRVDAESSISSQMLGYKGGGQLQARGHFYNSAEVQDYPLQIHPIVKLLRNKVYSGIISPYAYISQLKNIGTR